MINARRNIFFTLLLNLFNILIIIISGISIIASNSVSVAFIIPLVGMFFIPLGTSILFATHKSYIGIISLVIDFLVALIIFKSIPIVLIAFLFSSVIGAVIGYLIKSNVTLGISYFIVFITYAIVIVLSILILAYGLDNISVSSLFYDGYNNLKGLYSSAYSAELRNLYMIQDLPYVDEFFKALLKEASGIVIVMAFLYYFITKKIMESLSFKVSKIKSFESFYISNLVGAALIFIIAIGLIFGHYGYLPGDMVANAGISIIQILLVVNGSAFLYNLLLTKFRIRTKRAVLILILSVYLLTTVITIIGFVEMIFDFRKLDPNRIFRKKEDKNGKKI